MSSEIKEIKRLLDELQKANYLNNILLDSIPHPALLVNRNMVVIAANKLAKEAGTLVGGFCWRDFGHCLYLNAEDMMRVESQNINEDEVIAYSFCKANSALSGNECRNIEELLGDTYWDIYWIPTKEDGVYLHYAIDITERKKTEERLRESELRFKKLAEASFEGICIHLNGEILDCNTNMEKMFGYEEKELFGINLCNLIHFESGHINSGIYSGIKKDSAVFDVEVFTKDITYEGLSAEVMVVRDISYARLLRETMEMDRLKTEVFANVSHELRTPLNVIFSAQQLYEQYLKSGLIHDEKDRIGNGIRRMKLNCYRLQRLIKNLIDITEFDRGYISLHPRNEDIVELVRKVCLSAAEYLADSDISIEFSTDVEAKTIAFDSDRILTILLNLISNSIKFNKAGGNIKVNIHDAADHVYVSVEDTGIGIPVESQGEVFRRFIQMDKSLKRNHEGIGIGLSLVKSFVEMHDGGIWMESKYGKGSKFTFSLPKRLIEEEKAGERADCCHRTGWCDLREKINIEFSDLNLI